jgi:hypothetical protein
MKSALGIAINQISGPVNSAEPRMLGKLFSGELRAFPIASGKADAADA